MDEERKLLTNALLTSRVLKVVANTDARREPKSTESSEKARKEGNLLYQKNSHTAQQHEEILRLYNKSIALAPTNSEVLALAYGNRSAFLLHIGKYEECLQDIGRSFKLTKSNSLKEKLLKRKQQCINLMDCTQDLLKDKDKFLTQLTRNKNITKDDPKELFQEISSLSLDDSRYEKPKDEEESILEALAKKEKEDSLSAVSVKYNEKYGRYLVATRDIKPGEMIFVEKPYVASLNVKKSFIYCCHCLTVVWAGIPCEGCCWYLFCSEKCKTEAQNQYHDIECSCIPYVVHFLSYINEETGEMPSFDGLSLRALVKGLREAGSFEKFKAEMIAVETTLDKRTRGFSKDGKFENDQFRSLYSLSSSIPPNEMNGHVTFAAVTVICLAKYTKFFGKNFEYPKLDHFVTNPNILFIGSLILRLAKISNINSHAIMNVNGDCKYSNDIVTCRKTWCCVKGSCIVPVASLTNNSCNPNARRCFTSDLKFIFYAIQPIKKNSQVYDCYFSTFFESPNPHRQNTLQENFSFKCDCIACEKNWPVWPIVNEGFESLEIFHELNEKETMIYVKNKELVQRIEKGTAKYDTNLLQDVAKAVGFSFKYLRQPSIVAYKLCHILIGVFEEIYGYDLQDFDDC